MAKADQRKSQSDRSTPIEASGRAASATDEHLVHLFRTGDEPSFATIVERYRQELYHFLVRMLSDRALAEDVFQETFLQVYSSIDTFDVERRFKPWLFTIAANKARDQMRRRVRRSALLLGETVGDDDEGAAVLDLLEAPLPLPGEQADAREVEQQVREVVATLPDHLREILMLAYFHQFAYKEIAQMLSIPLGTVKSRLHAAVGTFADLWRQRHEPR